MKATILSVYRYSAWFTAMPSKLYLPGLDVDISEIHESRFGEGWYAVTCRPSSPTPEFPETEEIFCVGVQLL